VINKLGIHHLREKERKTPGPVISRTLKEKSILIKQRFLSKTFQKQTHFLSVFFLVLFLKSSAVQFNLKFLAVVPSGLRCVVSVHVNKTKQKSQDPPPKKKRITSGRGNKLDQRPKISSGRSSEETEKDRDLYKSGGFSRKISRMETSFLSSSPSCQIKTTKLPPNLYDDPPIEKKMCFLG